MLKTIYTDSNTKVFTVKYYVATEKGYLDNLYHASSMLPASCPTANSALLLGNSYILATIALLPDTITTLYHCDSDEGILEYSQELIQRANNSENYSEFKQKISSLLDSRYPFVSDRIRLYYNNQKERFISERILSEDLFQTYKKKINTLSINYSVIDILNKKQVSELCKDLKKNHHMIGLFSISNIMQFDQTNFLANTFFSYLVEHQVSASKAPVLYSWYTAPKKGEEQRPQSKYLIGSRNLVHLNKFQEHLNDLKEKTNELERRGYPLQADVLKKLHGELFLLTEKVDDLHLLSQKALQKLSSAQNQPLLKDHRGCGALLAMILNTLIQFCSLGLVYCVTGRFALFSPPTNTVKRLESFSDSVSSFHVNAY